MLRAVVGIAAAMVALLLLLAGLSVRVSPRPKPGWKEFSIAPASGWSVTINDAALRADGITLQVALAVAYSMPAVRIIGPGWIAGARYAMVAEALPEERDRFRQLLREELQARFHVDAHVEPRPFDVFVLSAAATHDLEPDSRDSTTWISSPRAELHGATTDRLAAAVESVLGKPVVNESGVTGKYRIDFSWGEDRIATVTSALRNKYGLVLIPAKRSLDALVIDGIEPDGAVSVLTQVGRLTSGAPRGLRRAISHALTVR